MNTLVYCIEHEEMVQMEVVDLEEGTFCGHIVNLTILGDGGEVEGTELDFCEFDLSFAYCPPPAVEEDWIEHVVEPGEFLPDQYSQYDIEAELVEV
jgi:hypothetical protein